MRRHSIRASWLALVLASLPCRAAGPTVSGIPNFHQVDAHVYRGGQPMAKAWSGLAQLGVKTVIDLRRESEHSAGREERAVQAAGMLYVNIPLNGVVAPPHEKVAKALALLNSGAPVFVHCRRGADRTGTIIACYRIAQDHWSSAEALREARSYGMSWIEVGMKRYVMHFHPAPQVASAPAGTLPATPAAAILVK